MKKLIAKLLLATVILISVPSYSFAESATPISKGEVTSKTILGGALSFLIWPGIGQAINDNREEKVLSHVIVGLLPPFRFWSCYDAVVDRKGGYWEGKI